MQLNTPLVHDEVELAQAFSAIHPLVLDAVTFRFAVKTGRASVDDIEDWVEYWHKSPLTCRLSALLGFTDDEYAAWVKDATVLPVLVN